MRRVWKPLDVNGLRLYKVVVHFPNHPRLDYGVVVAARSPSEAARLIEIANFNTEWVEEPIITGHALKIYQPASWWEGEESDASLRRS